MRLIPLQEWLLRSAFCFAASLLLFRCTTAQVTIEDRRLLERPIDRIEVSGNEVTQDAIILREMKTKPGSRITEEMLNADLLRVLGLDIFSRVEFLLTAKDGETVLEIVVTEEWYIFPLPFWSLTSDQPPKVIYGFRYVQKNFRGRTETLKASLWGGADRGFSFSHVNPWVRGTPSLMRSVDLYQITQPSRNVAVRDLDLEAHHTVGQLFFGKRWSVEFSSQIGSRFRLVQADNPLQLAGDGYLDRIVETMIVSTWDGRDLKQLPRKGLYAGGRLLQGWLLSNQQQYQRLFLDLRSYVPVGFFSFCSRLQWYPSWGNVPPYDWIIVEDAIPIRSNHLDGEGKSFIGATLETRFDIVPLHYFSWQGAPFLKSYFRNLTYGLAVEVFLDAGDVYNQASEPAASELMWGYGLGLLVRLPYVDVLRLESSWNPDYSPLEVKFSWRIGVSF